MTPGFDVLSILSILRAILATLFLFGAFGCATTPPVGGHVWHEQRIEEIEQAYRQGEISAEAYLSLKNEADATRQAYQEGLRDRAYDRQHHDPFGFPFHGFHGFR